MTKHIYICGDSFCVSDPEYGPCWVDHLSQQRTVTNLAKVSATNLMISMQVDQAIEQRADFIIVQGTACTRSQTKHQNKIVPYSFHTASKESTPFNQQQLDILKQYYTEFFDLDLAVYENKCIIESTLHRLVRSGISFLFDQGGFEHPSFGSTTTYFDQFRQYRSKINLWDYTTTRNYRPYYHIVDSVVHQQVADYYLEITQ
jgi:hypothetical protein